MEEQKMLPARLSYARKAKRLTQAQLGKLLGRKNTTVSGWEVGSSEPSYDDLGKLSEVLEVSIDWLLGKTDNPNIAGKEVITDVDKVLGNEKVVYWKGQPLTPEQQKKAKDILEALLKKDVEKK